MQSNRETKLTEFANSLKNLWQELDHCRVIEMKCAEDTATLNEESNFNYFNYPKKKNFNFFE